jgi:hypothetical protein
MSKQTAVDKFHDAVNDMIARRRPMTSNEVAKIWAECKEMEKEQVVNAHLTGLIHPLEMEATKQAKQYYDETYNHHDTTTTP